MTFKLPDTISSPAHALDMDMLAVGDHVPLYNAVKDIRLHGHREIYCTTAYGGWESLNVTVAEYVRFITLQGYVTIFGQKVIAFIIRDKAGDAIGFEVRLGV